MHAPWLACFLTAPPWTPRRSERTYSSKLPILTWDCLVSAGLGSDPASWLDSTRSCQRPSHCPPLPWLVIASSARGASSGKRGYGRLRQPAHPCEDEGLRGLAFTCAREPASFTAGSSLAAQPSIDPGVDPNRALSGARRSPESSRTRPSTGRGLQPARRDTSMGYRVATVDELQTSTPGAAAARPVRHHLGITAFGTNAWTAAKVGDRLMPEHEERPGQRGALRGSSWTCSVRGRRRFRGRAVGDARVRRARDHATSPARPRRSFASDRLDARYARILLPSLRCTFRRSRGEARLERERAPVGGDRKSGVLTHRFRACR